MELFKVSQQIESKIRLLEMMRGTLTQIAKTKANAISNYEKQLTLTIMKLRNGVEMEFEGQVIKDPPVTILEKIARGICHKYSLEREVSEAGYKNAIIMIQTVGIEMNALQSVFRHMTEV